MADAEWYWMMEDASGAPVHVPEELASERWADKAEAEAWVGEVFADLLAAGVDRVSLYEGDAKAYSMSLHAE
ncbi:hypothetical protein IEQ44_13510 [Nocardioides sp. Y6]|uniref:Uncharacterized protein n=1 Tax=Nocardioides malaquae TaxID=2773426 RepID=A0ABR9RVS5_9ACTN|nr:hypothetical protein [Nocardioides malaquae]MBE7325664.1 hypothetical protein [Nocardioides malaquae]